MRRDDDLSGLRLACPVHRPGDPGYERLRPPSAAPRAVVECRTEADAATAAAYARARGIPVSASTSDGLLLDLAGLRGVEVSGGAVTAGVGVRSAALVDRLAPRGVVVPIACCPAAGVLAAARGPGPFSRYFPGDPVLSVRVLLADGRVVVAEPSAGIALAVRLRTRPAVPATAVRARWDPGYAAAVIDAWQRIAPAADPGVNLRLSVTAHGAAVSGLVVGTASDAAAALGRFTALAGVPVLPDPREWASAPHHGCPDTVDQPAASDVVAGRLPALTATALADHVARSVDARLDFVPGSGEFVVEHRAAAPAWVAASRGLVRGHL